MYKLLYLLRFSLIFFFLVTYGHASIISPIDINTTKTSELNTSSTISPRSFNYNSLYTFTLNMKKNIIVELQADYFFEKLYLINSNNNIIGEVSGNSIEYTRIIKSLEAGTYIIDVTSSELENSTGTFSLSLKNNIIKTTELSLNSSIGGELSTSSGISKRTNRYSEQYIFEILETKNIVLSLDSNFNNVLYLIDSNGTVLEREAKIYNNSVTRIVYTLNPGIYIIDVTESNIYNLEVGQYNLSLKENNITSIPIELNTTISGEWTSNSYISAYTHRPTQEYTFTLGQRTDVIIASASLNGQTLYLYNNENYRYGSSIENRDLILSLPSGVYRLEMTTLYNNEFGNFELIIKENVITHKEIALDSIVNSEWTNESGISPNSKRLTEYYTFTLTESKNIVLSIDSLDSGSIYLLNEDDRPILNISRNRRIVMNLDAGTYTIDATSYWGEELREYTLPFSENNLDSTPLLFNQEILGTWNIEDSMFSFYSKRSSKYYTFSLAERTDVSIALNSDLMISCHIFNRSFSTSCADGEVLTLDAGNYTIDATTWFGDELGTFDLLVSADIFKPKELEEILISNINSYSVTFNWINNDSSVVGYQIYINNKLAALVESKINKYTLSGLKTDSKYSYWIVSFNSAGESKAVSGTFSTKKDDFSWLVPIYHIIL